ncbi:unnamed protein product [Urochloa humidicola]
MSKDVEASPAACCRICLSSDGDKLISPCMCKGTQQFVHRTCLDHWRAVKEGTAFSHCTTCKAQFHLLVEFLEDDMCRRMKFQLFVARDVILVFLAIQAAIATIAGVAYLLDRHGKFRNRFAHDGDHILSKHPILFYYCVGCGGVLCTGWTLWAAATLLVFRRLPCSSIMHGWMLLRIPGLLRRRLREASCLILAIVVVIIFVIPGVIYGCIAATMAFQNIMQRHYHILNKKELTKAYIVEDLQGGYTTPPKMNPEHEQRLKMLHLMWLLAATYHYFCLHLLPMHTVPRTLACCLYTARSRVRK